MPGRSEHAALWVSALTDRDTPRGAAAIGLQCLLALLISCTIAACSSDDGAARLEDYLARLARPLDTAAPAPARPAVPRPPRWTALQQALQESAIDGLDFLKLRGCALQQTVARRNSSLGRMAAPSQRLLLELDFLEEVGPCIDYQRGKGNETLADALETARTQKQAQLPVMIFNATLGSEEYRHFWRGENRLGNYPAQTSSAVRIALDDINAGVTRWLKGDYSADEESFELALSEVAAGDGGELLLAMGEQAAFLDSGAALMQTRAAQGPLCTPALQPGAAKVLRTVARKYFIGVIQPAATALAQRQHLLLPPIQSLESELSGVLPETYRRWRDQRNQMLTRWSAAPGRHVQAWQALLGSCFTEFAPAD